MINNIFINSLECNIFVRFYLQFLCKTICSALAYRILFPINFQLRARMMTVVTRDGTDPTFSDPDPILYRIHDTMLKTK